MAHPLWYGIEEYIMHMLTRRFQSVNVVTLSTLRDHLKIISRPDCRFEVGKVRSGRITVRSESLISGKKVHSLVVFPTISDRSR